MEVQLQLLAFLNQSEEVTNGSENWNGPKSVSCYAYAVKIVTHEELAPKK